jgi:hypothetical protein
MILTKEQQAILDGQKGETLANEIRWAVEDKLRESA